MMEGWWVGWVVKLVFIYVNNFVFVLYRFSLIIDR